MYEPSSAKVIQWASRLGRAERVDAEGRHQIEPIVTGNGSAVFEAEAAGKLRFISERTRMYWQRKLR